MKSMPIILLLTTAFGGLLALEIPTETAIYGRHCEPPYVPTMCTLECRAGYQRDVNGCATCACLMDMCETTLCAPGTFCKSQECASLPCTGKQAKCIPLLGSRTEMPCPTIACDSRTICPNGYKKDASGCDTCQCDDLCQGFYCLDGEECIENDETARCIELNTTTGAQISFKLSHNMDNITSELPSLEETVRDHVAKWLTIQKQSITEVVVMEHEIHVIRVDITIVRDGDTDLYAALVHFQELVVHGNAYVQYGHHTLNPLPDVSVKRSYEPPAGHGICEWLTNSYNAHPALFVLCALASFILFVTIFLILLVACCTSKRRRLAKRFEVKNYDKNLAFISTTYPKVDFDDCDKLKLDEKDQLKIAEYNQLFISKYPQVVIDDNDKLKLAEHDQLKTEGNA